MKKNDIKEITAVKRYRVLHEKVQDTVARYLRHCMNETFQVLASMRDYKELLYTVNPEVMFYITDKGEKLFEVSDNEHRLSEILGNNLAVAAKWDKRILDNMLKSWQKDKIV